ncbi:MAG: trimeric intracellular cation channel family protein [Clostridia bacterium]|nr:trimeric intracellular cation channel family protein [Clostridia bacterium]
MFEIIKILEIIGSMAFALSGSLVAIDSGLDIFGVAFVACITAFGGGMIRDILLGITPPAIFSDLLLFLLAIIVALIVFIAAFTRRKSFNSLKIKIEYINNIFDAIGLSAFVVIGSEISCANGFSDNGFIVVFVGMITGVGGGIFRDVLIDTTPYIFKKHIYALAAIFGSFVYFILRKYIQNVELVSIISMLTVFSIRMLATKYRWSLPKIHINDDSTD